MGESPAADDDRALARFPVIMVRMLLVGGGVLRLGEVLETGVGRMVFELGETGLANVKVGARS